MIKDHTIKISQRGYLQPRVIIVCYGQRPKKFRCHKEAIWSLWLLQFIMAKGYVWLLVTTVHFSQNTTTIKMSQRGYMWYLFDTVYGQKLQKFWCHRDAIWGLCLLQFVMPKGFLQPLGTIVYYGQRTSHLRCHRDAICGFWSLQFTMAKGHNNWNVPERLFAASSHYSLLWPKTTTIEMSQRILFAKMLYL